MKLTKVLVGLFAVSLCGTAMAVKTTRVDSRTAKQMVISELVAMYIQGMRDGDLNKATIAFTELKSRADYKANRRMLKDELTRRFADGEKILKAWEGGARTLPTGVAVKSVVAPKTEPATTETKAGAWAWGVEPKWDLDLLKAWGSASVKLALKKTLTADEKIDAAKIVFAVDNDKFNAIKDANDLIYKPFVKNATKLKTMIK